MEGDREMVKERSGHQKSRGDQRLLHPTLKFSKRKIDK